MKIALITGITGQDGSYLAEFLLEKGYQVHGIKRRSSSINTSRIDNIYEGPEIKDRNLFLHYGDLSDAGNLTKIISTIKPDEIYNLGAQSHVAVSFDLAEYTTDINALGALRILEAMISAGISKTCKYYQASSSELYGLVKQTPQNELTPFHPRSPYAVAKLFAYWITINYREAHGIFACNGILFNHESNRRGETFVSRKITRSLCRITLGIDRVLELGNLDAKRDWGHAKDYVEMQWLMLQQSKPDDYVISTGISHTVRQFVEITANVIGFDISWEDSGLNERGVIKEITNSKLTNIKKDQTIVVINKRYYRPAEVDTLLGDASKAKEKLSWTPKISFREMINEMVQNDMKSAEDFIHLNKKNNF